ncbi:thiamine-repressible mitochondrial transport protein THI74-like [Asparagus officinalis]|nr:thiamine-repressible mitochondrial transport protein THI74-like [Asparagus officinalis]
MDRDTYRWILGLTYIFAIAAIWIAASYIVQSVEDAGVSPFLLTYICNSLFMIYIPLVEISRYFDDSSRSSWSWWKTDDDTELQQVDSLENVHLIPEVDHNSESNSLLSPNGASKDLSDELDAKGRWTRTRVAKVSLLICPFWFFAQLAFNLSLKYTTVTSNTILSSTSSLFTFLVSLAFLGEKFSWVKLISILLCMGGTIIVSLGDSESGTSADAKNPVVGDILSLAAAATYSIYITLIRKKLPDEGEGEARASTAQFLGFLGFFNFLIFLPVVLVLYLTKEDAFDRLKLKQFSLIVAKGLLDNVLSDYLWVKATQLTTTTVATAGLSIQVPIAAIVDSITGRAPGLLEYLGAAFVMVGFAGINVPSDSCSQSRSQATIQEQEGEDSVSIEMGRTSCTS